MAIETYSEIVAAGSLKELVRKIRGGKPIRVIGPAQDLRGVIHELCGGLGEHDVTMEVRSNEVSEAEGASTKVQEGRWGDGSPDDVAFQKGFAGKTLEPSDPYLALLHARKVLFRIRDNEMEVAEYRQLAHDAIEYLDAQASGLFSGPEYEKKNGISDEELEAELRRKLRSKIDSLSDTIDKGEEYLTLAHALKALDA